MSDHLNHHSPAANDPALDSTGAQRSDTASSGYADGTAGTPFKPPSPWNPESMFDYDLYFGPEQPLTPGGPSTGFAQPLSVDDDPSDLLAEIVQSVASDSRTLTQHESYTFHSAMYGMMLQQMASDALTMTQQESSTFDSVADETMRQPLSLDNRSADPFPATGVSMTSGVLEAAQQEQQSGFGVSAYDSIHVSFASEEDLDLLSEIYAGASASDSSSLVCCAMHKPEDIDSHRELGRLNYDQAFAAKNGTVVLKAQVSGRLLGCVLLQPHILHNFQRKVPLGLQGDEVPRCLKQVFYKWIHKEIHEHRRKALERSQTKTRAYGTLHYCKYRYFAMFRHESQAFATDVSGQYDN